MLFNSLDFFWFFPVVCGLYWALRTSTSRKVLLLVASYWFYANWDWRFCFLLFGSSICDYIIGLQLARTDGQRRRRMLLATSLAVNLGLLMTFKYLGFFVESAVRLLARFGIDQNPATLEIILPVGISFYTFQTLSYTIDLYRREIEVRRSALDFFLFVGFFPQLVAGPIVRAREFLPQLDRIKRWNTTEFFAGLDRFLIGLFKKLVIADGIGSLVDGVYASPENYSSIEVFFGAVGFCYQIYADFSGYSDMAIGLARMLGFNLPANFRLPYLACSITDYWRRWHMTLSFWFRDYLYITLGGNRAGAIRTYRNLITTFLLTGLWHGANWTFVMFGAWNGAVLILERLWRPLHARFGWFWPETVRWLRTPVCWGLATLSTIISFNFFRSASMADAWEMLGRMVGGHDGEGLFLYRQFWYVTAWMVVYHLLAVLGVRERLQRLEHRTLVRAFIYTVYACLIISFAPLNARPFIYFQF